MTEFVEFCREYGAYILGFVCFVLEIILIFIKRRPKTVDDFLYCLNEIRVLVPDYVKEVECPGNGEIKKSTVKKILIGELEKNLSRSLTVKESEIAVSFLDADIEAVLAAPQKKEIFNEK